MALVVLDEAPGEVKTRRGEANVGISPPCTMSPRTRPIFMHSGERRGTACVLRRDTLHWPATNQVS